MSLHVIVGAGPVGSGTATQLAAAGHQVRVLTRSGSGPRAAGIELVRADAADRAVLRRHADGAAALYNCANPPYHRWPTDWPPLAAALLGAAEDTGAVLVIMGNLYGYGEVGAPMTEDLPLAATGTKGRVRAAMWADALAAHRAGRARVTEARASDFFGPGALQAMIGPRFVPPVLAGRTVSVLGAPDVPHTWSYLPDVARALVVLGTDERAWGRAWHVPSPPPLSLREVAQRIAALEGAPAPRLRQLPRWLVRATGLVLPAAREFEEVRHQHERPFVLDSTLFSDTFGLAATPMDEALKVTAQWWRERA